MLLEQSILCTDEYVDRRNAERAYLSGTNKALKEKKYGGDGKSRIVSQGIMYIPPLPLFPASPELQQVSIMNLMGFVTVFSSRILCWVDLRYVVLAACMDAGKGCFLSSQYYNTISRKVQLRHLPFKVTSRKGSKELAAE